MMNQYSTSILSSNILFWTVAVLSLIPLFFIPIQTLDGPAHLYNAIRIIEHITGGVTDLSYSQFNPSLVPNWGGHLILIVCASVFQPLVAEQLTMVIICVTLISGGSRLVSALGGDVRIKYFILPFCLSFPFLLGFYNFSLGVGVYLHLLASMEKNQVEMSWSKAVSMSLLLIALYFSHAFVLSIGMIYVGIRWVVFLKNIKGVLKYSLKYLLIVVPAAVLLLTYLLSLPKGEPAYLPASELVDWLGNIRSILVYHIGKEAKFSRLVLLSLVGLISLGFGNWRLSTNLGRSTSVRYLVLLVILLVLYFLVPDSNSIAGYFSVRLNLLFFVTWIPVLASLKYRRSWPLNVAVVLVVVATAALEVRYLKQAKKDGLLISELEQLAEERIQPDSRVYLMNSSSDWTKGHIHMYTGVQASNVEVYPNYELQNSYFPLILGEGYLDRLSQIQIGFSDGSVSANMGADYYLYFRVEGIEERLNEFSGSRYETANFILLAKD